LWFDRICQVFNLQASQHFHCFTFIVKRFRVFSLRRFNRVRQPGGPTGDELRLRQHRHRQLGLQ
ncbi:hypothetical protein ABLN72_13200, partial [Mycobacterium tuberculosis]